MILYSVLLGHVRGCNKSYLVGLNWAKMCYIDLFGLLKLKQCS